MSCYNKCTNVFRYKRRDTVSPTFCSFLPCQKHSRFKSLSSWLIVLTVLFGICC